MRWRRIPHLLFNFDTPSLFNMNNSGLLDVIASKLREEGFSIDTKDFSGFAFVPVMGLNHRFDVLFLDFIQGLVLSPHWLQK